MGLKIIFFFFLVRRVLLMEARSPRKVPSLDERGVELGSFAEAVASHQEGVDAHVVGPAWVGGRQRSQSVGIGVTSPRAHQNCAQLWFALADLSQGLPDAALH